MAAADLHSGWVKSLPDSSLTIIDPNSHFFIALVWVKARDSGAGVQGCRGAGVQSPNGEDEEDEGDEGDGEVNSKRLPVP